MLCYVLFISFGSEENMFSYRNEELLFYDTKVVGEAHFLCNCIGSLV